jgi:glycolate oxidase iron-sulfur subunit
MSPDPAPLAARIATLADACVLCGLCLPHCPTYRLDRIESESPRGRIMRFRALADGQLDPDPEALTALDHCLACGQCERVCPANVQYGALLQAGRQWQRQRVAPTWRARAIEWLLPRPLAVRWALRASNLLRGWLPGPWRRLPPAPAARRVSVQATAVTPSRGRVALFAGCMGEHFEAGALDAAARVLGRLGYGVDIAHTPSCCRAVQRHAGVADGSLQLAMGAGAAPTLALLTLASGCHHSLASGLASQADVPPVRDLFDFLDADDGALQLRFRAAQAGTRVALHLPCTQRNGLRNGDRIATWLARIDGLTLVPLDGGCCGAAGSHMLLEPVRADALRAPLLDSAQTSGATTLCSSNVGCRMHLAAGLEARGDRLPLRHPIELLAEHLDD